MGYREDLARVRDHPAMRQVALRRAGTRDLAEDALQQTYYNVVRVNPENIRDLHAFFCKALIREIARLHSRPAFIPIEDIDAIPDDHQIHASPRDDASSHIDDEVCSRLLGQLLLARLGQRHDLLMASVTGRSPDHRKYRSVIAAAAARILQLLLAGHAPSLDWNAVLKDEYPQYFDEPQLARNARDQRLSRARRDVLELLRKIVVRAELAV
jgi:DNA-directed RNA polymerase specialized sigma24 family protein